MHAMSQTDDGY